MLVKLTQDLKNGFTPWKAMLHENGHKLKEHGITCICNYGFCDSRRYDGFQK